MSDQPAKGDEPELPVGEEIDKLARRLREAEHLEPEIRAKAADLLGKLNEVLNQPSADAEDLAQSTAELVRAVHEQHKPGLIEAARERVEGAVARAETTAPVATDIVLRLIDVLAGIGI